jgi:hypothetical protein
MIIKYQREERGGRGERIKALQCKNPQEASACA